MISGKLYPAKYVGEIRQLKNETALIRTDDEDDTKVLAQFDDLRLRYHGIGLAFNWHKFNKKDFKFRRGVKANADRYQGDKTPS